MNQSVNPARVVAEKLAASLTFPASISDFVAAVETFKVAEPATEISDLLADTGDQRPLTPEQMVEVKRDLEFDTGVRRPLTPEEKALVAEITASIEAAGGLPSQRAKAKLAIGVIPALTADEVPVKRGMADSSMLGNSGYARNERDLYSTEAPVTEALCKLLVNQYLSSNSTIWEPACGEGAMVDVLKKHFNKVISSDIVPLCGDSFVADFLVSTPKDSFDAIITNPPYGADIDLFMRRALTLLRREPRKGHSPCRFVAFVARHELDCASGRAEFFGACPEYFGKVTLTWRPRWIKGSTGSPRHNYAIYLWARRGTYSYTMPQLFYVNRR